MRKSAFKRFIDLLRLQQISFSKIVDRPAGSKMAARTRPDSKRGCDGTIRR